MCAFTTPKSGHNQDINVSNKVINQFYCGRTRYFSKLNKSDSVCHRLWWVIFFLLNKRFSKNIEKVSLKLLPRVVI